MTLAAIQALYGNDAALREEANRFLTNLSEDISSWGICLNLLHDNTEQIKFFAANLLYTKIKKNWHEIDTNAQGGIAATLSSTLKEPGIMQFKTAMSRICSSYAAVAARSENGVAQYISEALTFAATTAQMDTLLMLEMLRILPEEVETIGMIGHGRDALKHELAAQLKNVMEVVVFVLTNHQDLAVPALMVIKGWSKHKVGLYLTALIRDYVPVYEALCHCFSTEALDLIRAAAEVMAEVVQLADPSDRASREGALAIFFEVLTKRIPHCFQIAQWAEDEEACFALCDVATSLCRLELEYVAEAKSPLCLEAVDFLVVCTACPQRRVSSLVLDFWLCLQDIGLEDRHVALGQPLYARLLDVLLAQCAFPDGGDFLAAGLDEDEWASFREGSQGSKEVLITVFYALGFEYVMGLSKRLQEANQGWEAKEVCLFALQAASKPVVDILSQLDPKGYTEAQGNCIKALGTTLALVAYDPLYQASPAMMKTGSQLILSTSRVFKLLGVEEQSSIALGLVGYLGVAAKCSDAATAHAAALGFRAMCPMAVDALTTSDQALILLVETWQSVAASSIVLEDLLLMTEAVIRLLVSLSPEKTNGAISMFMGPVVTSVHQALAQPQPDEVFVSNHLRILTTAIRFLDLPQRPDGSHVADEFLNALYPVMQETLVKLPDKEEAAIRLFDLMGKLFLNLRETVAPQLEPLLQAVVDSYRVHHFPGSLIALAAAVEAYGRMENLRTYFTDLFNFVCQETFPHLHASAELVAGFFDMAYRFLLFAPFAVLEATPLLETTVRVGMAHLDNTDRDAAKNSIAFITQLVLRCDGLLDAYRSQINILVVSTLGQELICAVITGLTKTVHPHLRSNLATCLFALVFSCCENNRADLCHQWIESALVNDPLKSFFCTSESKKQIADCFLNLAQIRKQKFVAMALDLAKICNKEATADVMVGYFM